MYFEGAQVKSLVLMLRDHFPGAELVFDCLFADPRLGEQPPNCQVRLPHPLGNLAWTGDRKMGRRHPPAR